MELLRFLAERAQGDQTLSLLVVVRVTLLALDFDYSVAKIKWVVVVIVSALLVCLLFISRSHVFDHE